MDNPKGCPHLIFRPIRSQVIPMDTSQRILPHILNILQQRINLMDRELVDSVDLTTHDGGSTQTTEK
jgi:hypothetical protein